MNLATASVTDFGAAGDGTTDDRAAFQAALDSGASLVTVPAGAYLLGQGAGYYCLTIPAGVTLRGEDRDRTVLHQAPGVGPSVRLLQATGPGIAIESLTLDGQRVLQATDEHRAGVFATGAPGIAIRHVTARGFTGDGFYVHIGSHDVAISDVLATDNARNGITFGGGTHGGSVTGSRFVGNLAQQFDSEPGPGYTVDGLTLTGNTLDGAGVSDEYVLTVSGSGSASRSKGWRVEGNTINGGVFVVWADGAVLRGNTGVNATSRPSVRVYRTGDGTAIDGNAFAVTQAQAAGIIAITGAGTGQAPSHVLVTRNELRSATTNSIGVAATGALSVEVSDNTIRGPGSIAVYLRATNAAEDFRSAVVRRNRIAGWSNGLVVRGNGAARLLFADVSDNIADDTPIVMSLDDDGSGALQAATVAGNVMLGSTATMVSRWPSGMTLDPTAATLVLHRSPL